MPDTESLGQKLDAFYDVHCLPGECAICFDVDLISFVPSPAGNGRVVALVRLPAAVAKSLGESVVARASKTLEAMESN